MAEIQTQLKITAEIAERIVQNVTARMFTSTRLQPQVDSTRSVIWNYDLAKTALEAAAEAHAPLPQRALCHLLPIRDEITVLAHFPQYGSQSGAFLSLLLTEYRANYRGDITHERTPFVFTASQEIKRRFEQMYKASRKKFGAEIAEHKFIALDEAVKQVLRMDEIKVMSIPNNDPLVSVFKASAWEYYAFSPYVGFKEKKTAKQAMQEAMNPRPDTKKKWSAIEIISLRIPKKREDAEPGTGKKLDMRIQVVEHLRRQPTKKGIKLITIAQHERGPKDAPLKPKVKKVYKVVK